MESEAFRYDNSLAGIAGAVRMSPGPKAFEILAATGPGSFHRRRSSGRRPARNSHGQQTN